MRVLGPHGKKESLIPLNTEAYLALKDLLTLVASQKFHDSSACLRRSLPKQHVHASIHRFELRAGNVLGQILAEQEIAGNSIGASDKPALAL